MKVKILSLDGEDCVIETKFGILNVIAKDDFEVGNSYYVEVDFTDVLKCSEAMLINTTEENIIQDKNKYLITAELLTAEDGLLTINLDKGLASIDAENTEVLKYEHEKFIKFAVSEILIFKEL
jgi:hypothetical protein